MVATEMALVVAQQAGLMMEHPVSCSCMGQTQQFRAITRALRRY
jgi:hypothetical protein